MIKCFIDVDGVVANFVQRCCEIHNVDESVWPVGAYEFPCKELHVVNEDEAWENIARYGSRFWAELELMPDAREIVNLCEHLFGQENCAFLTSPPKSIPAAAQGKLEWINNHFPRYRRQTLIGACKEFCAGHNKILIDDYLVNVSKFNAAGGQGVLVPRPWNEGHEQDTMATLESQLVSLKGYLKNA